MRTDAQIANILAMKARGRHKLKAANRIRFAAMKAAKANDLEARNAYRRAIGIPELTK